MTTVVMNAGQKMTVTAGSFVDGAGNPVGSLPAGAKMTFAGSGPISVTPNADGVSAAVIATLPPQQGALASITATLTFTDSLGFAHTEYANLNITVNYDPGVVMSFGLSNTTPA